MIFLLIASLSEGRAGYIDTTIQRSFHLKPKDPPKNVILLIGDGMGLSQISAGLVYQGGDLNLGRFKNVGFIKTHSQDDFITDSAAGATAFACGQKTYNGAVGVDSLKIPAPNLIEIAGNNMYATGVVVTCALTHATPACFAAHQPKRSMQREIAHDLTKSGIDVAIGGGQRYFSPTGNWPNLLDTLRNKGYTVADSSYDLSDIRASRYFAFTGMHHPPSVLKGRGNFLERASLKAIETLSKNDKGFFLMIEGSQIDWGGHDNDAEYIATEMADFDRTIGKVLDWAELQGNTIVIVTADHETGGFALNDGSYTNRTIKGAFTTKEHTGVMVPVFAYGPGSDIFTGIYDNTEIFNKIIKSFGALNLPERK